jgi:hypothetical protein
MSFMIARPRKAKVLDLSLCWRSHSRKRLREKEPFLVKSPRHGAGFFSDNGANPPKVNDRRAAANSPPTAGRWRASTVIWRACRPAAEKPERVRSAF